MELNLKILAPLLQYTSIDRCVLFMRNKKKKLFYSPHLLSLITVPLSLIRSHLHLSTPVSQLRAEAHRQRCLLNSGLKLIVNVTDPSPDPCLRRSTPLPIRPTSLPPIRPTPTPSSPSRKPPSPPISLFSLL